MDDDNSEHGNIPPIEELKFRLKRPVTWNTHTYNEITVREPTGAQLRQAASSDNGTGTIIELAALTSGIPPNAIEMMLATDIHRLNRFFASFIRDVP